MFWKNSDYSVFCGYQISGLFHISLESENSRYSDTKSVTELGRELVFFRIQVQCLSNKLVHLSFSRTDFWALNFIPTWRFYVIMQLSRYWFRWLILHPNNDFFAYSLMQFRAFCNQALSCPSWWFAEQHI